MEYDLTMYNEDRAISCWVFNRKFKTFYYYKEDLVQSSVIALYHYRSRYDETKGSYSSYAVKICFYTMLRFIEREKRFTNNFENLSIDLENDEGSTLLDVLGYDFDFDTKFNYEYLLKVCNDVINKHKSNTFKNISKLYLAGKTPIQIAKVLNISKQCAWQYKEKFKNLVQQKLKEYDFELQENICNKKVIQ